MKTHTDRNGNAVRTGDVIRIVELPDNWKQLHPIKGRYIEKGDELEVLALYSDTSGPKAVVWRGPSTRSTVLMAWVEKVIPVPDCTCDFTWPYTFLGCRCGAIQREQSNLPSTRTPEVL